MLSVSTKEPSTARAACARSLLQTLITLERNRTTRWRSRFSKVVFCLAGIANKPDTLETWRMLKRYRKKPPCIVALLMFYALSGIVNVGHANTQTCDAFELRVGLVTVFSWRADSAAAARMNQRQSGASVASLVQRVFKSLLVAAGSCCDAIMRSYFWQQQQQSLKYHSVLTTSPFSCCCELTFWKESVRI